MWSWTRAGVALATLFGVVARVVVATGRFGPVDGDEAVVGLMARRLLDGEVEAFFWGQEYGGIHESVLVALLLLVRVPVQIAMEIVPVGLAATGALLLWRIGRRLQPSSSLGVIAALVYWCGSPVFIWWSTKLRGFYGTTLVLALLIVLLTLRIADGRRRLDVLLLGLVAGSGWYASPMIVYLGIPAAVSLVWFLRDDVAWALRSVWLAIVGFVIAAAPWLVANLDSGFASLETSGIPDTTYDFRLTVFRRFGLPTVLGFKVPMTLEWVEPARVLRPVWIAVLGALAGVAVASIVSRGRIAMIGVAGLLYPFVFALIPTAYYYGEPRYLFLLWPVVCLLLAWALTGLPRRLRGVASPAAVVAVAVFAVVGLRQFVAVPWSPVNTLQDVAPPDLDQAIAYLDRHGIDRAWGDYWIANRVTLLTDEDIVVSPVQLIRHQPYEDEVLDADTATPYLLVAGDCYDREIRVSLDLYGIPFGVVRAGEVAIIQPAEKVTPDRLLPVWARARGFEVAGDVC